MNITLSNVTLLKKILRDSRISLYLLQLAPRESTHFQILKSQDIWFL